MSSHVGVSFVVFPLSSAHVCLAPSILRRLLMHGLRDISVRALMKFGAAATAISTAQAATAVTIINLLEKCTLMPNDKAHT